MPDTTTLGGYLGYYLWFLGQLTFKWVPGVLTTVGGSNTPQAFGEANSLPPITSGVTTQQVVSFLQTHADPGYYAELQHFWTGLVSVSVFISLVFGSILVYSLTRIVQIRRMEYKRYQSLQHTVVAQNIPKTHLRWQRVLEQVNGENEQGWRLAILEADIMLNELLDVLGYRGETMADKMRQVDRANFHSIDMAWEAHRVRNRIAHEGSAHDMTGYDARRTIELYERVFREFKFVE